ncbi:MAG: hypothetical protein WCI62_01170, partial [Erysipelotrichaceae bacterium]
LGIFLCSLLINETTFSNLTAAYLINIAYLLEAIPMALFTYLCLRWLKLRNQEIIIKSVCTWLSIFVLLNILIGLGNDTLVVIFGSPGFYALLFCTLLSAYIYTLRYLIKKG